MANRENGFYWVLTSEGWTVIEWHEDVWLAGMDIYQPPLYSSEIIKVGARIPEPSADADGEKKMEVPPLDVEWIVREALRTFALDEGRVTKNWRFERPLLSHRESDGEKLTIQVVEFREAD